jgi:hydrogenase/urease accessory protein HupE
MSVRSMSWRWLQVAFAGLFVAQIMPHMPVARAHEIRPAHLQIDEVRPGRYQLLWRTPVLAGMRLPVVLGLPDEFHDITTPATQELSDSLIERRVIDGGRQGLAGKRIDFVGLQATITDVLVRMATLSGAHSTILVHPAQSYVDFEADRGLLTTAGSFLLSGIEHILLGVDHLLFILGLLLIVKSTWMLFKTITAFTVAHSITLAIATLGYAQIPTPPLNAAIALSILFLGPEIIRSWRGETSFTIRNPWVVAFAFGLLHGFGFASGLTAIGLPSAEIPLALLMFNLGVEIGQLAFVTLILLMARAFTVLEMKWPRPVEMLPAAAVGSLGAFWTIERLAVMLGGAQ